MTPSEFKAWFDGFTEVFTGTPTKAQWTRIKARVAEIDGKPVTHTVYVDRYLPNVPVLSGLTYWGVTSNGTGALGVGAASMGSLNAQNCAIEYDSHKAMLMAGRAEAKSLAA